VHLLGRDVHLEIARAMGVHHTLMPCMTSAARTEPTNPPTLNDRHSVTLAVLVGDWSVWVWTRETSHGATSRSVGSGLATRHPDRSWDR
jgi:hypothetical protein